MRIDSDFRVVVRGGILATEILGLIEARKLFPENYCNMVPSLDGAMEKSLVTSSRVDRPHYGCLV